MAPLAPASKTFTAFSFQRKNHHPMTYSRDPLEVNP
jgi:hypothetical protein